MNALTLAKNLFGLSYILKRDPKFYLLFDCSRRGFWQSFWVPVFTLPIMIVYWMFDFLMVEPPRPPVMWFVLVNMVGYAVEWLYWPNLMISISKGMERQDHYYRYLVPYHWFRIIGAIINFPIIMLVGLGVASGGAALILQLGVIAVLLYFDWFMAKTALDIPAGNAGVLVFVDFMCWMALAYTTTTLY